MTNIVPLEIVDDTERLGLPSASSFARTVSCPGWNNLWRLIVEHVYGGKLPPETKSKEAERGVRIHLARETSNILALEDESEVKAYDRWLELETTALQQWLDEFKPVAVVEGPKERRFWLRNNVTGQRELSGRLDAHFIGSEVTKHHIFAPDGKTGAATGSGKAESNWQGKVTAVLLYNEYPGTESVTFSLIKPEAFPNGYFDSHTFKHDNLVALDAEVRHHVAESQKPDAPRYAGDHCQYCPCRGSCPEAAAYSMLPSIVANTAVSDTKADVQARVALLQPADWAFIQRRASIVKNILEAAAGNLRALGEDALAPLGFKLGKGRTTTEIPNQHTKQACEILSGLGLPEDDLWQCLSVNKTQVVEAIMKQHGVSKPKATELYDQQLSGLIAEKTGEPILREI